MLVHKCMDQNDSAALLTGKRSVGITPEVNLRNTFHTGNKEYKKSFETQSKHHQKSKAGVSVAPKKGHMCFKNC